MKFIYILLTLYCRTYSGGYPQDMFVSHNVGTEGLLLSHFLSNNNHTEILQETNGSLLPSRYGNAFTSLNVVRRFANSQKSIREWCHINDLQKTDFEKFLSDITEAFGTDEEGTGCLALDAFLGNLRKDTDTVDNILLQILCSHFNDQIYVRQFSAGMQRFIRLSDGNITYQHEQLDTDCFVVCNRSNLSTINSNHQVLVPMEILMTVLRAKDFSSFFLTPHMIENVSKNVSGILLHKRYTYLETLRKQFHIRCMLQFYAYNNLLVLMSASNNQVELLKKLSSDLQILDGEKNSYLIDTSPALNGSRFVVSDGGTVEKIIRSGNTHAICTYCWINIKQLPDPAQWQDATLKELRTRGVDPESCYLLQVQDNVLYGCYFLWKIVLTLQYVQCLALRTEPEYNDNVLFTSVIDDFTELIRFQIKIPKNSIQNVKVVVKYRTGHMPDATVARKWMENFPLTMTDWSLLKNNTTTIFRVCGIDNSLSVEYIKQTIKSHLSEHFYVDSVTVNYKTNRKCFNTDRIQNIISDDLMVGMDPVYNFSVNIDTEQSATNILGTIETAPARGNDLESRIKSLEYRGQKVRYSAFSTKVAPVNNCLFKAIAPELESLVKQCPSMLAYKSTLITDYVALQLSVKVENRMDSKYKETLGKVNRLMWGKVVLTVNEQYLLCSREGLNVMSATCDKYSTAVEICKNSVVLFGSGFESAVEDIKRYQSEEREHEWKMLYIKDIEPSIKTATKMSIILKTWVKLERRTNFIDLTYNYDYFNVVTGIKNVYIDLQVSAIKYIGSDTATDELQSLLKHKLSEYLQMIASPPNTEVVSPAECVSCFMPILTSMYHSLHKCGHLYCHECLLLQMEVASQSKSFPLTCAAEECNSQLSWLDVEDLYLGDKKGRDQMINSALVNFVATKSSEGFFCQQPDCSGLLLRAHVEITASEKTACDNCGTLYCIMCKVPCHEGQSCSEYRKNRITLEHHLQEWIDEKKNSRKLCPYCDSGIEKNGGCKKIYCINCRMHICWVCLDYFTEASDAYYHLSHKHGSII